MALQINHPGMSRFFFDLAVKRAMDAELCIQKTARASVVAVGSSQDPDLSYLVTRTDCGCEGHRRHGRCFHRALAIAFWDVFSTVELGSALAGNHPETAA